MIWINPMDNHDLLLSDEIPVGVLVGVPVDADDEAIVVVAVGAVYRIVRV